MFDWLAGSFSDEESFEREVITALANGDFAYLVALEHTTASIGGVAGGLLASGNDNSPVRSRGVKIVRRHAAPEHHNTPVRPACWRCGTSMQPTCVTGHQATHLAADTIGISP